jgi:predicted nucleic acid-binding protein
VAGLVDTNILVYRFDPRDAMKQRRAQEILRTGLRDENIVLAHQCLIEFVAVVIRPRKELGGASLLSREEARLETEKFAAQYDVLYPNQDVLLTALRGTAMYGLSWFDAHLWAYAEVYGVAEICSEDFEHGRHYGRVRAVNPFLAADGVHELPALYAAESASALHSNRSGARATGPASRDRPYRSRHARR